MKVAVLFGNSSVKGTVNIVRGKLDNILSASKHGKISGNKFAFSAAHNCRLEISVSGAKTSTGALQTIVNIFTEENPFSFNLRDVRSDTPIFIPEFAVAVVPAEDNRSYSDVADAVGKARLTDDFARYEIEPEETFEHASARNRKQACQTWLGLGRDMRMFRVGYQGMTNALRPHDYWGQIQPVYHTEKQKVPGCWENYFAYQFDFAIGQGASCRPEITRELEDGVLPILRSVQYEQDMQYHITAFTTLEKETLKEDNVIGSDAEACYPCTGGCMLKKEEIEEMRDLLDKEMHQREQEVVCCMRVEAVNTGRVPRYAWFRTPHLSIFNSVWVEPFPDTDEFANGFSSFKKSKGVLTINRLEGKMLEDEETALLIQPGQKAVFEMLIPHSPISMARAKKLAKLDFDKHLNACRDFWRNKLKSAASISVPEKHIDESIKAGILHCDLVTLGKEPDGTALATIGWYGPIGTESAPIIQYYDSIGWHKLAERSLEYFFDRQHDNGFIQNYCGYQSETGAFLWSVGEHYRYTLDKKWFKRVLPKIKKSVNYLLEWRERNKKEEYREKGFYGMIDGKVADPDDFYHSFFLNSGTYVGMKRIAEICSELDPKYGKGLAKEVKAYREDIRTGFYYSQARSPVMPLGDGSWAPLMPPWVDYTGGISFYADGGNWFSHGAFASRSCLTGPLWLIISEVIDADEIGGHFMIKTNQYPVSLENAALSQPYYCRHDFAHIKRREVKPFLKTFYNQLTGLQDQETYTWWEHYFHASEHKTHEEGWFLMQTRWMLWFEEEDTLSLLRAIPRKWLEDGKEIIIENVKTYFGALSFKVSSNVEEGTITAEVTCDKKRAPNCVEIRLPHPDGLLARKCSTGKYNPETESVMLKLVGGKAKVSLSF